MTSMKMIAQRLRELGLSYREISIAMDISCGTLYGWLKTILVQDPLLNRIRKKRNLVVAQRRLAEGKKTVILDNDLAIVKRRCYLCTTMLPISEFYWDSNKEAWHSNCKQCHIIDVTRRQKVAKED